MLRLIILPPASASQPLSGIGPLLVTCNVIVAPRSATVRTRLTKSQQLNGAEGLEGAGKLLLGAKKRDFGNFLQASFWPHCSSKGRASFKDAVKQARLPSRRTTAWSMRRGRIIDLTPAAARAIGLSGLAPVTFARE
jgi:hypothetical protein